MRKNLPRVPALELAIEAAGGISKLAQALGFKGHQRIHQWRLTRVPAEWCPDIEELTGVRCEDLRSDVNWKILRRRVVAVKSAKAEVA